MRALTTVAVAGAAVLLLVAAQSSARSASSRAAVRVFRFPYRASTGARRNAYLVAPRWYRRDRAPALPLIISPHGRGRTGRGNVRRWGELPARGSFLVVSPDGQGRRLDRYSWGYSGQIADLARMPALVEHALPWVRVDRREVYVFGGSMGGQEALLLAARHPSLLAGAAAFDAVADLARQYHYFARLHCNRRCRELWREPLGRGLRSLAREEVGGSPRSSRAAYAARSPLTYVRRLARDAVPLQLWWSLSDRIVGDQANQSGRLFRALRRLGRCTQLYGFVGFWRHSHEFRAGSRLPLALAIFGLLPRSALPSGGLQVRWPCA